MGFVQGLGDAVDPSEAQGLLDRIVVGDGGLFGLLCGECEPYLGSVGMVLLEPLAPFAALIRIEYLLAVDCEQDHASPTFLAISIRAHCSP